MKLHSEYLEFSASFSRIFMAIEGTFAAVKVETLLKCTIQRQFGSVSSPLMIKRCFESGYCLTVSVYASVHVLRLVVDRQLWKLQNKSPFGTLSNILSRTA